MTDQRVFNVLVAEDESFQRLALLDILTLCNYDAVAVENGQKAYEELKNEHNNFDLLLLDLYMPVMTGFQLLDKISQDPKLKDIPVVIMSANESSDIIAQCIEKGAKDYLVKPIRINECKGLVDKMKKQQITKTDKLQDGIQKYEKLRDLGHGAAGSVTLIRNKQDQYKYALKTINLKDLQFQSEKDRKNAQMEVMFLRVLEGPTLIQFHESFVENDNIYIVMEYAEGGNLAQLIQKNMLQGKKMSFEQIMIYLAQIVLGVKAMHSKNILHRDLKTQNIFITKGNVLKIGDFGISKELQTMNEKAMTSVGTPYFMPPEICLGKPYDSKADVWAIGIILYELITYKKPFDSDTIHGVFDKIVKHPFDPLPPDTNANLTLLVSALLNKDYNKRPNTDDVMRIPCVRKAILQFVSEYNCRDQVMIIFDLDDVQTVTNLEQITQPQNQEGLSNFVLEQMEEMIVQMRKFIKVQDYKNGWFSKHIRCVQGIDIFTWILENIENTPSKAEMICQKMLEKDLVQQVSEGSLQFNKKNLYRLYMDRDDIADNLVRRWKSEVRNPLEASIGLVEKIEDVYKQAFPDEEDLNIFDAKSAMNSNEFNAYLIQCSELEKVNLQSLSKNERIAFFLNVYQCMYIHHYLRMEIEGKLPKSQGQESMFSKLKSYVLEYSSKPFYYNISGQNYNLDEIKHGILRGNKKSPNSYSRSLSNNDPRLSLIGELNDSRINFVCLDFPDQALNIDSFNNQDELNEKLNNFVTDFLGEKVNIEVSSGEIVLPKSLNLYKEDFGGTEESILRFVLKYYQNDSELDDERLINEVCVKKSLMIRYE